MSSMLTDDGIEVEVFPFTTEGEKFSYLELSDPRDPAGQDGYAIRMIKADRKHLIALLLEVDK